ncbi:hypothetical protein J6590_083087, partial [Homalodisca vitripennis]
MLTCLSDARELNNLCVSKAMRVLTPDNTPIRQMTSNREVYKGERKGHKLTLDLLEWLQISGVKFKAASDTRRCNK